MKKRFEHVRSNQLIADLVLLAVTAFLLITSISTLVFTILIPDSMLPTIIGVVSFITIALYLLPKIKSEETERFVELNTDNGGLNISGRIVKKPDIINIMKYGIDETDKFIIKFPTGESIDSREYKDPKRFLTLLPRVFPEAKIFTHQTKPISGSLIILGLILAVTMFIVSAVI
ncbi:MAG: hypothetical protein KAH30_01975 [Caldisericia bacterium]|nr:hypothetical protein [Caldisericia bacterium]